MLSLYIQPAFKQYIQLAWLYGHPCLDTHSYFLEMQQQVLGIHTAAVLIQQVTIPTIELQSILLAKAKMLHPKNFCFSYSCILTGFTVLH